VTVSDMVDLNVKMGGNISNPTIKTDLKQTAGDVTKELKQQATAFVQQKTEETKQTLKDTATAIKNQVVSEVKNELVKQLTGTKDSTNTSSMKDTKEKTVETLKNTLGGFLKKKKNTDSTKQQR
jgi:F0F1-type ATP synthase membrane subunit b/b'